MLVADNFQPYGARQTAPRATAPQVVQSEACQKRAPRVTAVHFALFLVVVRRRLLLLLLPRDRCVPPPAPWRPAAAAFVTPPGIANAAGAQFVDALKPLEGLGMWALHARGATCAGSAGWGARSDGLNAGGRGRSGAACLLDPWCSREQPGVPRRSCPRGRHAARLGPTAADSLRQCVRRCGHARAHTQRRTCRHHDFHPEGLLRHPVVRHRLRGDRRVLHQGLPRRPGQPYAAVPHRGDVVACRVPSRSAARARRSCVRCWLQRTPGRTPSTSTRTTATTSTTE